MTYLLNDYCGFACNGETPKRGRIAGGVCIFVKSSLISGIELLKTEQNYSVFLLLKKSFFGLMNDIIFGVVYIPPSDSERHTRNPNWNLNSLKEVLSDLKSSHPNADFMISDDYNAWNGIEKDFLDDGASNFIPGTEHFNELYKFPNLVVQKTLKSILGAKICCTYVKFLIFIL